MFVVVERFAALVLAFLAIIAPVFVILLSIFREGSIKLSQQYEHERTEIERKIQEQAKKNIKIEKIEEGLKELKRLRKSTSSKLALLDPKQQIARLFGPLLVSYISLALFPLVALIAWMPVIIAFISIIGFVYGMIQLWNVLKLIIEAIKGIDDGKKAEKQTLFQTLGQILEASKGGASVFLDDVHLIIGTITIRDDKQELSLESDKKVELAVSIENSNDIAAKNVEAGLIFPREFLIEKMPGYSVYTDPNGEQIVRYSVELIHGSTNLLHAPLSITPLKRGDHKVRVFIKGENIKVNYKNVKIIVRDN